MGTDGFRGWPADALAFYDELAADNTKVWWHANKARFEASVRGPMLALAEEVADEFGPLHIFRPFRDTRFAKDKTPYKSHLGAVTEGEGGASYYLHLGADGLYVGTGYYHLATDQLARYRAAVAGVEGTHLPHIVAATEQAGFVIGGDALKTAPRGYPRDHPRIDLLRRKGLVAGRQFTPARWLATRGALARVTDSWRSCAPLLAWLDTHVGPSELPPDDAW
jgi:uncharacterized protein (TIGR02453 family)